MTLAAAFPHGDPGLSSPVPFVWGWPKTTAAGWAGKSVGGSTILTAGENGYFHGVEAPEAGGLDGSVCGEELIEVSARTISGR